MKKRWVFLLLLVSTFLPLSAMIRKVKTQVEVGCFTSIQQAINSSVSGDTVLVYPGRYFENILYGGRNITVASLYLTTEDRSYINSTIIDGRHQNSVVRIMDGENDSAVLCGFTIENGKGTHIVGVNLEGGGIYIEEAYPVIKSCIIQNNWAIGGGGIDIETFIYTPETVIPQISDCVIKNNTAYVAGGILLNRFAKVILDPQHKNSVFNNIAARGHDIYSFNSDVPFSAPLDTVTVGYDLNYLFQYTPLDLSYEHTVLTLVNHDLYVATNGDDANSGLTEAEPLKTIAHALYLIEADSLHPRTIHLAAGTYSPSLNQQLYPVNMKKYVSVIGAGKDNTILDAEEKSGIFEVNFEDNELAIRNLQIRNLKSTTGYQSDPICTGIALYNPKRIQIEDCNFIDSKNIIIADYGWEGTPIDSTTSVVLRNLKIDHFTDVAIQLGAEPKGILENIEISNKYCAHSDGEPPPFSLCNYHWSWGPLPSKMKLRNIYMHDNYNFISGWPFLCAHVGLSIGNNIRVDLTNMTITNSTAEPQGGIIIFYGAEAIAHVYNTILYGNHPNQIWFKENEYTNRPNKLYLSHCVVEGGESAIMYEDNATANNYVYWLEGNQDTNPFMLNAGSHPAMLGGDSPCIDAGTSVMEGIELPATDILGNPRVNGNEVDIGAFEYHPIACDFYAEPLQGNAPLTVVFHDISSNEACVWSWDFNGDGIEDSNQPNPTYTYQHRGTYTVVLKVNRGAGIETKEGYIVVEGDGNEDQNANEVKTEMMPATPNPFCSRTMLPVRLAKEGNVEVVIYNIKGQRVRTLLNALSTKGEFELNWDGLNNKQKPVSSGIYTAIMKVNGKAVSTQKITLLR